MNIIDPYEATVEIDPEYDQNHKRSDENYKWGGKGMEQKLQQRANEYLFERIVRQITSPEPPQP